MAVERDGAGYAPSGPGSLAIANVRAFVAIHLDAATRAALASAALDLHAPAAGLPVAWVAPENFHVTLKFLGGVNEGRVPDVIQALHAAAAGHRALEMHVGGLGAFPSATRPRVLWAGIVGGGEALAVLAAAVDERLAALGFPREARAFAPHITLARVREPRRVPALADVLVAGSTRHFGRVAIDHVALMRSDLSPRGARYTALASVPLSP